MSMKASRKGSLVNTSDGDIVRGVKHTYDVSRERWRREECEIILANEPFAQGGMRVCIRMYISEKGPDKKKESGFQPGVAKAFKKNILPRHIVSKSAFAWDLTSQCTKNVVTRLPKLELKVKINNSFF
jgi:hypothetical protein